jgi:hypothetical protein
MSIGKMAWVAGILTSLAAAGCGGGGGGSAIRISSVSPKNGPITGGTLVTITGSGFVDPAQVTFGGTNATSVTVVDINTLTCITPSQPSTGPVQIVVTVGTDTATYNSFTYFITPTLTIVNPNFGPVAGFTPVTLTGTGFLTGATVEFGGVAAVNTVVVSATSITTESPPNASGGAVDVKVTNTDGGDVTMTGGFTYNFPPGITSISPTFAELGVATTITITGTDFYGNTSNTAVNIGATPVTPATVAPTQITFAVPTTGLTAGIYDISVVNPDNQTATLALALELYDTAQTIFVNAGTGNDTTGDGSLATPYKSIKKGLQAATAGKTIVAANGAYNAANGEVFPLAMKVGVALIGESASGTVIDGGGAPASVMSANALTGQPTVIARVGITGARTADGAGIAIGNSTQITVRGVKMYGPSATNGQAEGIEISSSTVTVDTCVIQDNHGKGGMRVLAGIITCKDTTIDSNTNEELTGGGAGAYIDGSSTLAFDKCTISNNDATLGSVDLSGGGMYVAGEGIITHSVFFGNKGLSGGGIYTRNIPAIAPLVISNSIFHHNTSLGTFGLKEDGAAAAIFAIGANNEGTAFLNCVFANNTCRSGGSTVFGYNLSPRVCIPTIHNCIIFGSNANGYHAYLSGVLGSSPKLMYTCFFSNTGNDLLDGAFGADTEVSINSRYCSGPTPIQNVGNIIRDPKFRNAATNDYRLGTGSNCIDMGDPGVIYKDVDTTRNDIGAYGGPAGNW